MIFAMNKSPLKLDTYEEVDLLMKKEIFIKNIQAASKQLISDLVIKNITVVDVFQNSTFISDVAICGEYIVGIGEYTGKTEIDGTGKYICPGLIDGHAHIESSLLTPKEYYKAALLHGITSMIVDPHEIANVLGIKGINLMMDLSENLPLDFYFMLPSCVPSTPFENSGAILNSLDLKPLYASKKVLGLAEVMDSPSVINCSQHMIDKLYDAVKNNSIIDGHGAGFDIDKINSYTAAYIKTDHECHTYEELIERVRRGMSLVHVDDEVAKSRGLNGPFVHDLCAFGYVCRLAIAALFPGHPEKLRRMYAAMKTVLYPDTPVALHIWKLSPGKAAFRLVNQTTGKAILDKGELDWDE